MSKTIKYILIVIAVLIIAGLAYAFWPQSSTDNGQSMNNQPPVKQIQQDQPNNQPAEDTDNQEPEVITSDIDTSNWKTYRNEELGFEVKYPNGWYHREDGFQFTPFPLEPNNDIGIFIGNVTKTLGIKSLDYNEAVSEVFKSSGYNYEYIKKHKINLKGQKLIQAMEQGNLKRSTFFMNNNNLWVASFVPGGEIPIDIYNAMLLSFRLLD